MVINVNFTYEYNKRVNNRTKMIETGIVEIDIDNIEVLIDSPSSTEKSTHLKNPFAQSKLDISNKRSIDQLHNSSDIEQCVKKIRHELSAVQTMIETNNSLDNDIIEVEVVVRKESDGTEEKIDKTDQSTSQHDNLNLQEKNDENTEHVTNNNNIKLENNNENDKEKPLEENSQVELTKNTKECEVVWTGIGDKSVENYIKEEVEKRVKEKVEAFENMAKAQMMEHELIWANKYKSLETEFAVELEKQKNEEEAANVKDEIQEEHKDELVQAILLEKKLEEKEIMLKNRIERLKAIESKFVQQILEIKLIRKQNRELLKMKIKEWEDEEKLSQDDQQELSIKDDEVLIDDEPKDCECVDDVETSKSKSSIVKIKYGPKLNESEGFKNTQLLTSRAEREKCRPTRMSPGEWEYEKNERNNRKRNLRIKGLKHCLGPRDLEAFFKRDMGVIVQVDHIIRIGTDIIAQFKNVIDKITILKRVRPNNIHGISITNDFTTREEEVQKWLRDEADWLRVKGYSVKTEPMRLMINGINWIWNEVLGDLIPETM